jgi:2-phosphoglycerate kinase
MIILIAGASHTGKTVLAQRLLEKLGYPYLSIDHLKMGLIRSGNTSLTPYSSDEELTALLWPIVREMIKTAIENRQDLTVEGCYIPFDWEQDFAPEYRAHIRYVCLVMSENYIRTRFADIGRFANVVEQRLYDDFAMENCLADNRWYLEQATAHGVRYHLITEDYRVEPDIFEEEEKIG